jgi:hypothetical protein
LTSPAGAGGGEVRQGHWQEGKLVQHGIKKVLPGRELLEEAYRRAWTREFVRQANHRAREQAREGASEIDVPDAIRTQLAAALKKRPGLPWNLALARLCKKQCFPKPDSAR